MSAFGGKAYIKSGGDGRACSSSIPRFDGAFCCMDIAINDLKVWQAPKVEQLRPRHIPVITPHPKKRNAVVNFSALP
jgi:hypothetical protein